MKQKQGQWGRSPVAQARREKLDDERARRWLARHSKRKQAPKPKTQPLERWQIRVRVQKQERRTLARPLLKGVE